MKLRKPWLIHLVAFFAAGIVRLWMGSLRYRVSCRGGCRLPVNPRSRRFIYAFWHESLLVASMMKTRSHTLSSRHADGELTTSLCKHFRIGVVRGSSSGGAVEALIGLRRASRRTHLGVTPDGPRGPRHRVKVGLAYLASLTGLPVVPCGVAYSRAMRFRSWDRFALPLPWSTIYSVTAPEVVVPRGLHRAGLEHYRRVIEERMLWATEEAERWAERACGKARDGGGRSQAAA